MLENLTTLDDLEAARQSIEELFAAHAEWFFLPNAGKSLALKRRDLDLCISQGRLLLSFWTENGNCNARIKSWQWNGDKLLLQVSRRMGAEQPLIELIPRASARAIAATIKAARQIRCEQLAQIAYRFQPGAKVERAALSPGVRRGQPGRYARIILRLKHQRVAVTGSVAASKPSDIDALLSSALLWFTRTSERTRSPHIQQLWLVVEPQLVKPATQRIALLRQGLRDAIRLFRLESSGLELQPVTCPEIKELWKKRTGPFPPLAKTEDSEWTKRTLTLAPNAIDVVRARHGETLRYLGLPFARVRRLLDTERVWFGVEGSSRRLLDAKTEQDWQSLLRDLAEHRSANALDHRHVLYRNVSEAWLESLLRRDITRLDPGLIIAPLHAQFRTARGGVLGARPIDLLALRTDGRLVVIELKVSEDRDHVLQGADYWQRVEAHRRRGHITRAKLFGERAIRNEPPLVYLVAPTLRFHPSFPTLARTISSEIEIYRFDINEDWRSGVRVMRRMRVN